MTSDGHDDPRLSEPEHSVMPGEFYCSSEYEILSALLGSCVAICLWDRGRQVGGMNHFVLPRAPQGEACARYGDVAIACLVDRLMRLGARTETTQAKVFGGADVLTFGSQQSIGAANVAMALDYLRDYGISVAARRTGGKRGRLITFHTGTGEVLVRPIPVSHVIQGQIGFPGMK